MQLLALSQEFDTEFGRFFYPDVWLICLALFFLINTADPFILPHQQVDKGAIKFILSGANIMCPGLTSPGAKLNHAEKDSIIVSLNFFMFHLILFVGQYVSK